MFGATLAALCALAAWARWPGMNPESLWTDDAWVALVSKVPWGQPTFAAGCSSPIGFTVVTKLLTKHIGDLELACQALPFFAAIAQILIFAWFVLELFESAVLALVAAAVVAVSPAIGEYATHAKQYTLESLGTIVLLWSLFRLAKAPAEAKVRALAWLSAAAVLFIPFAHADCFVALLCVHLGLVALWLSRATLGRAMLLRAAAISVGFDALFGAYYRLVLTQQRNHSLDIYWAGAFVPMGQAWPAWSLFLHERVWRNFFASAFPQQPLCIAACTLLFALGVVAMLWPVRPKGDLFALRPAPRQVLGLGMLACLLQAFALALLKLYPLGGYRLDIYLHPVHLLFVVAGLDWVTRRLPTRVQAAVLGALAVLLLGFLPGLAAPAQAYPPGKPASRYISELERDKRDDDLVLVYPKDLYTFALYTHWNVPVHTRSSGTGYAIASRQPRVYILSGEVSTKLWQQLRLLLGRGPSRVFYLAVHKDKPVDRRIERTIGHAGYRVVRRQQEDGAKLLLFVASGHSRSEHTAPQSVPSPSK